MKLFLISVSLLACFLFTDALGHHGGRHDRNNGGRGGNDGGSDGNEEGSDGNEGRRYGGRRGKHNGQRCMMKCRDRCSNFESCLGQCENNCAEGQDDSTCALNCIDACTADESNTFGACQGCMLRTPCGKRIVKCRVKYCGNLCPMNVSVQQARSNLACKQCMNSNCSHEILNVISKQKPRRMGCFAQCEPQCSDFTPCMRQCSRPCLEGQDTNQQQCFSNCIDICSTDENSRFGVCEGCMVETPCGQSISTCRAGNCETSCPNDLLTPSQMRQNPTCKQCMESNCFSEMMQPMNELIHRPVGCFAQCRSRCVSGKTCTDTSEGNCAGSSAQCARDCVSSCRANEANNS